MSGEMKELKEICLSLRKDVQQMSAFPTNEFVDVSNMFPVHSLREIDVFLMEDGNLEKRKNGLYNYLLSTPHPKQSKFRSAFVHALFFRDLVEKVRWPPNK